VAPETDALTEVGERGLRPGITAAVIARDEEDNILPCLESVAWADRRLVVVDDRTVDRTAELAGRVGAEVHQRKFTDFAEQRNAALDLSCTEWVFFIDADERATPELGAEIREVSGDASRAGWWVPRRNYIWGRWIRHAGWYPDYQLRLLRMGLARYDPERQVHELVLLDGAEGYLQHALVHYNYSTLGEFLSRQNGYATYEAQVLVAKGVRPSMRHLLSLPIREFVRRFCTLRGYRDGFHGFLLSLLLMFYTFVAQWRARALRASARR